MLDTEERQEILDDSSQLELMQTLTEMVNLMPISEDNSMIEVRSSPSKRGRSRRTRMRPPMSRIKMRARSFSSGLRANEIIELLGKIAVNKGLPISSKTVRFGITK